jgi:hypothetical protein
MADDLPAESEKGLAVVFRKRPLQVRGNDCLSRDAQRHAKHRVRCLAYEKIRFLRAPRFHFDRY